MKLVLCFAVASLLLASCMAQYRVGDRFASFGETDGRAEGQTDAQSQRRPRPLNQPEELGQVAWGRDLDAAKAKSAQTGKPILLLFQEVPG